MHTRKIEVIDSMGVFVRNPISPDQPHILQVDMSGAPTDVLGLHPDGRFEVIENELLTKARSEVISAISRWNTFPDNVRHTLSVLDQLNFRLKAEKYREDEKDIYWVKTDGFGPDDSEIAGENVLILFFDSEGKPLRWEVPVNG